MADEHPNVSAEALEELSEASDPRYWMAAAVHPGTPSGALTRMVEASARAHGSARHGSREHARLAVKEVAVRDDVTVEVVLALGRHPDPEIRSAAAANPHAPAEALRVLAARAPHDAAVADALAANPAAPPDVLAALVGVGPQADLMLASNPASPPELLRTLAAHDDTVYWLYLAKNPGTPADVLERLAVSDDKDVRAAVMKHPKATDRARAFLGLQ